MPTTVTTRFLTSQIPRGHKVRHATEFFLDDFAMTVGLQHKQFELIASVGLLSSTLAT
jgi:hypothetical protein